MKCLSKYQIQRLIDNELNLVEKIAAEQHLAGCWLCKEILEKQKRFSEFLKKKLLATASMPPEIPAFRVPENETRSLSRHKRRIPLCIKAAAVLLPAILI